MSPLQLHALYGRWQKRSYFPALAAYMTSGPCVVLLLTGEDAVNRVNALVGHTDPLKAAPSSIRGAFGLNILENTVHSSDAESADAEIAAFFEDPPSGVCCEGH